MSVCVTWLRTKNDLESEDPVLMAAVRPRYNRFGMRPSLMRRLCACMVPCLQDADIQDVVSTCCNECVQCSLFFFCFFSFFFFSLCTPITTNSLFCYVLLGSVVSARKALCEKARRSCHQNSSLPRRPFPRDQQLRSGLGIMPCEYM